MKTMSPVEKAVHLLIFLLLLLASLVLTWLLRLYHRHRPDLNVLVLLHTHLVHTVLAANLAIILPVLGRLTADQPLPHVAAELATMAINGLVCLLVVLTAASSLVKLLLVTNFDLVFAKDPQQLASHMLVLSTGVALLPNLAYTLWSLAVCRVSSNSTVSYLAGSKESQEGINFSWVYLVLWVLVSLAMASLVVFGIPLYLNRIHTTTAIREWERVQYLL